jgi:hypothetical protein
MNIRFLYFADCPNSGPTLANLRQALLELGLEAQPRLVRIDSAEEAATTLFLGSPSILIDGVDLATGQAPRENEGSYACRVYDVDGRETGILPVPFIRRRLEAALEPRSLDA